MTKNYIATTIKLAFCLVPPKILEGILMNAPSGGEPFIRRGSLKEGGVYLLFLIYKGRLLEVGV